MATLDEIFAAMPDEAALAEHDYLVIDEENRQINVPESEAIFGVEADASAERRYFLCPRIVGNNVDLAACFLRVNFRNANGEVDSYLVEDLTITGDYVTFSWELSRKVTQYKGTVQFLVCACYPDSTAKIANEWHTTLAKGTVLEGMEPDAAVVEAASSDVIAQLLALVDSKCAEVEKEGTAQIAAVQAAAAEAAAAAKEQVEAKGQATLATIPEDYTIMAAKVNNLANAIKGKASGEVVRVDDVSPVEHTMAVKVRSKNIIPYPYLNLAADANGATLNAQSDGGIAASGTPTGLVNLILYDGPPLAECETAMFSIGGAASNVVGTLTLYDGGNNLLKQFTAGKTAITANIAEYENVTRWVVGIKRDSNNIEMGGIAYPQLEIGDTATEYMPYVAPEAVKVTRCGKNLASKCKEATRNGISLTVEDDGKIIINGTATKETGFAWDAIIPAGLTVLSLNNKAHDTQQEAYVVLRGANGLDWSHSTKLSTENATYKAARTNPAYSILIGIGEGETFNNYEIYLQVEQGSAATEYEPYAGAEYTPDEDGTVPGVASLAPTTTILTDTAGVTVELEYNRDTNLVIADILEKIAALSGTT